MPRVKKNSYDDYNSPFATRLRLLMDEQGVNQQKLADAIGVTRQAVSAYSLGISLPDIEKFEKIANYFDVSTEYLLGRTEIQRPDITKQAISETLQLSEEAIDKIYSLQKDFHLEQTLENDWKMFVKEKEPLADMFSDWLEAVDLADLMSSLYSVVGAAAAAQHSGYCRDNKLDEETKAAVINLKQRGYRTLTPTEQVEYYEQKAGKIFLQSVECIESAVVQGVAEMHEAEKEHSDPPKE